MPHSIGGGTSATSNAYDNAGRPTSRTDATGTATRAYDVASRATRLTDPVSGGSFDYQYDNANRLTAINRNAAGSAWTGAVRPRSTRTYDAYGRLASQYEYANPSGTTDVPRVFGKQFSYDKDSKIRQELIDGSANPADKGTHQYTYTALGQLASWTAPSGTVTAYSYDKTGNRTNLGGAIATFDTRNRPTQIGTSTLTWSDRGTLQSETKAGVPPTSVFDVFGDATQSGTVNTVYDGLGRIASRNGTTFQYSGLGQDVINDGTTVYGRSFAGAPISSKTTAAGSLRWLITDQHTDVIGTVNPVGGLMDSTVGFDPWGQVTGRTGTTTSTAGFQGD